MYKIRDAGVKGLGVFAATTIPRGTRILAEHPLFTVKSERDVYAKARKLDNEDKDWLTQLSIDTKKRPTVLDIANSSWNLIRNGISPSSDAIREHDTVQAVFRNNNFDIGDGTQALFRDICRVNHSCVPNGQGNFNKGIGKFTIHAVRPIDNEEEITISYLDEHGAPKHSRQSKLSDGYGFDCSCPICESGTELSRKSEERRMNLRKMLFEHAQRMPTDDKDDHEKGLKVLQALIELFENDGLAGRELSTMLDCYFITLSGMYLCLTDNYIGTWQRRKLS